MATDIASNPPNTGATEAKNARKKKTKADPPVSAGASTPVESTTQATSHNVDDGKANGTEGTGENAYIRELQKNIRNATKKLNATQKVDAIIAENPGVSLDELVATRKINNDQKAQALKKPHLQAQIAQLEEQLSHFKKFEMEFQQRLAQEKELLQSAHKKELERLREEMKAEAAAELQKTLKQKYIVLSQFLRQAAAKRQEEGPDSKERQAFEGVLLLVYGGDAVAVDAIEKVVEGSDAIVSSVDDVPTGVTYAEIKKASIIDANPFSAEQAWVDEVAQAHATGSDTVNTISSGPTLANVGFTELDNSTAAINGQRSHSNTQNAPATASVEAGAANAAAEEQWDRAVASPEDPMAESFEIVPRDPQETENPHAPAPNASVQSWADDTPAEVTVPASEPSTGTTASGDGFHEVHHNRGGRGRGGYLERGGFRGRGPPRGDGRGRGSFRGRGDRGNTRGSFRGNRAREGAN